MPSKTPQFDKALDEYFAKLELDEKGGQWRTCRFSGEKFYVRPEDIEFYKKIRVPLPTLSPHERRRRRLAMQNAYALFRNISAHSGKKVVTMYPPGSPFKIYETAFWHSDDWRPEDYAKIYDHAKPFFDQFRVLQLDVPRAALLADPSNRNSDYTNASKNLKNCYLTFEQNGGENLYYHQCCTDDKNCIDCWALDDCDTCYNSKFGLSLYQCFFSEWCRHCREGYFLWDCRNCEQCFMSSNLRNKKHYFRNEYVGKKEWEKRMKEVRMGDYDALEKLIQEYEAMKGVALRKPNWNQNSVDVSGDYIMDSRNVHASMYVSLCERIAYSEGCDRAKDCYDLFGGSRVELCYEVSNEWSGENFGSMFSLHLDSCRNVEYSDSCSNCAYCFGCIGLDNKSFCILNKQYTETEYWENIDAIKGAMLAAREYGEFFPPQLMLFPYRATTPMFYRGLNDLDHAAQYGYDISDLPQDNDQPKATTHARDLPRDIRDVKDDILSAVILDEKNGKRFRLTPYELSFYRKYDIPLPREHPNARMAAWRWSVTLRTEFYTRTCPLCRKKFESTYPSDAPEKNIYCEACYLKEVV